MTTLTGYHSIMREFGTQGRLTVRMIGLMALIGLPPASGQQRTPDVEGIWVNSSVGNIYQIQGRTLRQFEVTSKTCVSTFVAEGGPAPEGDSGILFIAGRVRFLVRPATDADHLVVVSRNKSADQLLVRLERLPRLCTPPTPDTPPGNFEVFTETFAERYSGFDSRNVDWAALVSSAKSKISETTSQTELFDVLEGLLAPLHDLHTSLSAASIKRSSHEFWRVGPPNVVLQGSQALDRDGIARLFHSTEQAYPAMVLRSFCNGQLRYAHLDEQVGYLRILSFTNYSSTGDDAQALNGALDEIFSDPTLMGLIIDLRVNLGGDDGLGLIGASRLTEHQYPAYRVETRAGGAAHDAGKAIAMTVVPSGRAQFSGPVAALIGPLTMSAGEIFAAALMGRTPHITMIGEPTQGLLGGVLGRRLPNGWVFGLPNTRIVLPDGRSFEGNGIPPDVRIAALGDDDKHTKSDPALAVALEVLRGQLPKERQAAH